MVERKSGAIVNVSSLAAHNGGGPGALAYSAAKGAVISPDQGDRQGAGAARRPRQLRLAGPHRRHRLPRALHREGRVRRDRAHAFRWAAPAPPEEVAAVVAFLAGPDASYLSGETVEVNGGLLMR